MEETRKQEYSDVLSVLTNYGERNDIVSKCETGKELALGKIPKKPSPFKVKDSDGKVEEKNWVAVPAGEGVISLGRVFRFPLEGGWGTSSIEERLDKILTEQANGRTLFFTIKEYAVPEGSDYKTKVPIIEEKMKFKKAPAGLLK